MIKKRCTTFKGVSYVSKKDRWLARIAFSGVRYSLGFYKTKDEAVQAYQTALALGGAATKAWVNIDREYRGAISNGEQSGNSLYIEAETKIKTFTFITEGKLQD